MMLSDLNNGSAVTDSSILENTSNGKLRAGGATTATGIEADSSYRDILGEWSWRRLKPEIRRRFSMRPGLRGCIRYSGVMHTVDLSFMGWLFAQFCRLIGTPLAPYRAKDVPTEIRLEADSTGVAWIRNYSFSQHGTVSVRSTKKRGDMNDLVEHIGCGFSMSLALEERDGDLLFTSRSYNLTFMNHKLRIPDLLTPGITTVTHEQIAGDQFRFSLSVDHPIFGRTIYQEGVFTGP